MKKKILSIVRRKKIFYIGVFLLIFIIFLVIRRRKKKTTKEDLRLTKDETIQNINYQDGYSIVSDDPKIIKFNNFIDQTTNERLIAFSEKYGREHPVETVPGQDASFYIPTYFQRKSKDLTFLIDKLNETINIPIELYDPAAYIHYKKGENYSLQKDIIYQRYEKRRLYTLIVFLGTQPGSVYMPYIDKEIKGNPGDALLIYNLDPNGRIDFRSQDRENSEPNEDSYFLNIYIKEKNVDSIVLV